MVEQFVDEEVVTSAVHGDQCRRVVAEAPVKAVSDEFHGRWVDTLDNRVIAVYRTLECSNLPQSVHLPPVRPIGRGFGFGAVQFDVVANRIRQGLVVLVGKNQELCIRFG